MNVLNCLAVKRFEYSSNTGGEKQSNARICEPVRTEIAKLNCVDMYHALCLGLHHDTEPYHDRTL